MNSARPLPESPLVVSFGGGVDSTAILVGLAARGLRPDLILFADTGGEKPETYQAIEAVGRWVGRTWPGLTVERARYEPATRYETLEGNCLHNDTLPSLAFGHHSCSLKWKVDALDAFLMRWPLALEALEQGRPIVRAIGYDASGADSRRWSKAAQKDAERDAAGEWSPWAHWYPLREWGWTRAECEAAIDGQAELAAELEAAIGQRVPPKSACFFCPASKREEVEELARRHPGLALRAVAMERRAREGRHGLRTRALGISWSWEEHLLEAGLLERDWPARAERAGVLPPGWVDYADACAALRARQESLEEKAADELAGAGLSREEALEWDSLEGAAKWMHESAEALGAWKEIELELTALERERKGLLAPDWTGVEKRARSTEERRERRRVRERWRSLVEGASRRAMVEV